MKSFDETVEVLKKYNKEHFHIEHGVTVGLVFGWFAKEAGLSDEEVEYWKIVGLLHDIDFEMYPEEHGKKCLITVLFDALMVEKIKTYSLNFDAPAILSDELHEEYLRQSVYDEGDNI